MDNFTNIMGLILGCNGNFKTILESNDDGNFNIPKLQIGDLILRRMLDTKFYHAGVFCGQNDVIQFSGTELFSLSQYFSHKIQMAQADMFLMEFANKYVI